MSFILVLLRSNSNNIHRHFDLMVVLDGKLKLSKFILRWIWMCVPNFMTIHPIVVEIFHSEPQMSTCWWHSSKSQEITKVIGIHPLGTMNIWTKMSQNSIQVATSFVATSTCLPSNDTLPSEPGERLLGLSHLNNGTFPPPHFTVTSSLEASCCATTPTTRLAHPED